MKHNHHKPRIRVITRNRDHRNITQLTSSHEAVTAMIKQIRVFRADAGKVDTLLARIERELGVMRTAIDPTPASYTVPRNEVPLLADIPDSATVTVSKASTIHIAATKAYKWTRWITDERLGDAKVFLHAIHPFRRFRILATNGILAIIQDYDQPSAATITAHVTNLKEDKDEIDAEELATQRANNLAKGRATRSRKTSERKYDISELI